MRAFERDRKERRRDRHRSGLRQRFEFQSALLGAQADEPAALPQDGAGASRAGGLTRQISDATGQGLRSGAFSVAVLVASLCGVAACSEKFTGIDDPPTP